MGVRGIAKNLTCRYSDPRSSLENHARQKRTRIGGLDWREERLATRLVRRAPRWVAVRRRTRHPRTEAPNSGPSSDDGAAPKMGGDTRLESGAWSEISRQKARQSGLGAGGDLRFEAGLSLGISVFAGVSGFDEPQPANRQTQGPISTANTKHFLITRLYPFVYSTASDGTITRSFMPDEPRK